MDVEGIPTPLLNCCISYGPETPAQNLVHVIPKGYPALRAYAQASVNSTVEEHMKASIQDRRAEVPYRECKHDLYNESVKVTRKSTCMSCHFLEVIKYNLI